MRKIAIYVEGGGDTAQQKAELRIGFDQLLKAQKDAARAKHFGWKLVFSGGRDTARKNFLNAFQRADAVTLCVLLVDSEEGLTPESPMAADETPVRAGQRKRADARVRRDHVVARDGWDLNDVPPECVHLMVRCMETWIVADSKQLAVFYGKNFHDKQLPTRGNLEDEPKDDLIAKLARATKDTTNGEYTKIKHARKLLEQIHADRVTARCPRFATFTRWLGERIAEA